MITTIEIAKDIFEIIAIICFLIALYQKNRKPRLKVVETKTPKPKKKRKKYFRRIRIPYPYRGKTEILQYDQKHQYIESAWNEIQKPKKKGSK